ncbi:MAG: hypothetical protein ACKOOF_11165 [Planctomycetaceae bacterium]
MPLLWQEPPEDCKPQPGGSRPGFNFFTCRADFFRFNYEGGSSLHTDLPPEGRPRPAIPLVDFMRTTLLAVAALAFLRIVVGLHFFLEGISHLRDPDWSSAGFRKAAVGPLGDWYRSSLPQTGDWTGTLGSRGPEDAATAATRWHESVVQGWRALLTRRAALVPLSTDARAAAETALAAAQAELAAYVGTIADDLLDYRLQVQRLTGMQEKPGAAAIPFERERVAKKRSELAGRAAGWMKDAEAIGTKLVADWDRQLGSDDDRRRAAAAVEPTPLWKADRFVSWSLVTIGACLVLGILVSFNAMGGAMFLASVIASQPFWVAGAQSTYDQWVELAALLAIAALPIGGWSGLEYFLKQWCPLCRRCAGSCPTPNEVTR